MVGVAFPDGRTSRDRLLQLIQHRPGLNKSALCAATGLAWGTVDYHLRMLARSGLVSSEVEGRVTRLFPAASNVRHQRLLLLLSEAPASRIASLLRQQPGLRNGSLSQSLALSPKVVRRHLRRLVREGLVLQQGMHRPEYRLMARAESLLAGLDDGGVALAGLPSAALGQPLTAAPEGPAKTVN